jgi:CO/xanthine dehydrogenase FAD-binding subunit
VGPAPVVHEVDDVSGVAGEIASGLDPAGDMHASTGYRKRLARVLIERCLRRAQEEAERE